MSENRLKVGDLIKVGNKVFIARIAGAAISTALLILILLSACTPAPTTAPTLTATITLQPPTATNIPPTPTVTPVPTQSPEQVADGLGLRSEPLYEGRTFSTKKINGATYLVDGYNDVPKAVLQEDGTWSKLDYTNPGDAELMYGHLVPEGGEYIFPDMIFSGGAAKGRVVEARYLGDWETGRVEYQGGELNLLHLLVGLRDGGGEIHVVRLAYDSPDLQPVHPSLFKCFTNKNDPENVLNLDPGGGGSSVVDLPLEKSLKVFYPGERMGVLINEQDYFDEKLWFDKNYPVILNNVQTVMLRHLYNTDPANYRLSSDERSALERYQWPDRPVTLSLVNDGPAIRRAIFEDCYK